MDNNEHSTNLAEVCTDYISRQAAIDALIAEGRTVDSRYVESERIIHESDAVEAIAMLPSAQPERKTGKWIDAVLPNDNGGLPVQVCDQCNTFFPLAYTGGGHHYCPNCGARMEENNEDR